MDETENDMRVTALDYAVRSTGPGRLADTVIDTAEKFYAFLTNNKGDTEDDG